MKRQHEIDRITELLTLLSSKIRSLNSVNLTDLSVHSEQFFCSLLNRIYGYSLINLNADTQNSPAIDLGDAQRKIAFQVTATTTKAKLKATVDSFVAHGSHKVYDRLIVLQLVDEATIKPCKIGTPGKFQLDTKRDVWDNRTILKQIISLPDKDVRATRKLIEDAFSPHPRLRRAAFVVAAVAILAAIIFGTLYVSETNALRQQIANTTDALQQALQQQEQKDRAEDSGTTEALADRLTKLTDTLEERIGKPPSHSADDILMRLSRATTAVAEGRYSEVDSLLPDAEIEKVSPNVRTDLLLIKGQAAFEQRRWSDALGYFERVVAFRKNVYIKLKIANCHYYLGQLDEADTVWADVAPEIERSYAHGGHGEDARTAAGAMANRAGVLSDQGHSADAYSFATAALDMFKALLRKQDDPIERGNIELDIARTHARLGEILEASGFYARAEAQFEASLNIYQARTFGTYPAEYLAAAIHNFGAVIKLQERFEEAVTPLGAASKLYEAIVAAGRPEFTEQWAVCLMDLAQASISSDPSRAREVAKQSVSHFETVAKDKKGQRNLAKALVSQGNILYELGDTKEAIAAFERAIPFASEAGKSEIRKAIEGAKRK